MDAALQDAEERARLAAELRAETRNLLVESGLLELLNARLAAEVHDVGDRVELHAEVGRGLGQACHKTVERIEHAGQHQQDGCQAMSTEMTMLPKPQAIDSRVTMLGRANLARARRCCLVGFKSDRNRGWGLCWYFTASRLRTLTHRQKQKSPNLFFA